MSSKFNDAVYSTGSAAPAAALLDVTACESVVASVAGGFEFVAVATARVCPSGPRTRLGTDGACRESFSTAAALAFCVLSLVPPSMAALSSLCKQQPCLGNYQVQRLGTNPETLGIQPFTRTSAPFMYSLNGLG